jgi:UPF0755 protein
MNDFTKHRIWLIVVLILITLVFAAAVFVFTLLIPSKVEAQLGPPDNTLSLAQRIYLSAQLYSRMDALEKISAFPEKAETFTVYRGQSATEVAIHLEEMGFIHNADDLLHYWQYKGLDRFVRDGVYLIIPGNTTRMISEQLATGETGYKTFAFLAGWRKEEIDTLLMQAGMIANPSHRTIGECDPLFDAAEQSIEGFLSPGSYQIPVDMPEEEIYCIFVKRFFDLLPDQFADDAAKNGLTPYEAVILASIVQKELVDESEAARIAGVFYNRLAAGMPLQSDPTVQYAVANSRGGPVWWDIKITTDDLQIDSPYNTYRVNGLPPTPICNPGMTALLSVVEPENHDFLFFRATCDGSGRHIFSRTYEEHLAAACQ